MTVLNKRVSGIPEGAIYIGRGSRWGNEWSHLPNSKAKYTAATRDEACDKHEADLIERLEDGRLSLQTLAGLHNRDLVCYCAPARCHGHTLERAAKMAFEIINNIP